MTKINDDLQKERANCTFNIQELTTFIDGGPEKTKERKESEHKVIEYRLWVSVLIYTMAIRLRDSHLPDETRQHSCHFTPVFCERVVLYRACRPVRLLPEESLITSFANFNNGVPEDYLSHKEKYEEAVKKSVKILSLLRRMQEEGKYNLENYRDVVANFFRMATIRDGSPLALHYIMFMPAILNQGDEEQQAQWLARAWKCSIIGSYAQTELGHGTFIRGIETTATYDPSTQEFILNSPNFTSYKWWPGGIGQSANYSIVVAQLYTKGKCYGVHSFIVQLRDEETHEPLTGIKVGDIGAKMALNPVNNGFVGFHNVRIPRRQMLMKHAQVLEDGTYVKSRNNKLNYGAMVFVRVVIVFDMVNYLRKAVTIAVRYSAVRRQSQRKPDEPESQILDYLTQQHKLFVAISTCHAIRVTANKLWDTFNVVNEQLLKGNFERLPELHALACCLKAVATSDTAACVERCRLACGGHGYMLSSNLPTIYGHVTAACTYEGENTVLLLQTARFLAKTWQQVDSGKLTPMVEYLSTVRKEVYQKWENSVECIIRGFQIVSMRKIASCVDNMQKRVATGMSFEDAWNITSVQLANAAEAHCRVILISTFNEEINKYSVTVSPELRVVLKQLVELYSMYWALEKLSDLLQYTTISSQNAEDLRFWYEETLLKLRPNAVGLVDAFDIRDEVLMSTLGSYDGRVYERLMEETMKNPLNKESVNSTFHKYLKPFMKGKL